MTGLAETLRAMEMHAEESHIKRLLDKLGYRCNKIVFVLKENHYYLVVNFSRGGVRAKVDMYVGGKTDRRNISLKISTKRSDDRFRQSHSYSTYGYKNNPPPCGVPPECVKMLGQYLISLVKIVDRANPEQPTEVVPLKFDNWVYRAETPADKYTNLVNYIDGACCLGVCKVNDRSVLIDDISISDPNLGELAFYVSVRIAGSSQYVDIAYFKDSSTFLLVAGLDKLHVVTEKYGLYCLTKIDQMLIDKAIENEQTYIK